MTPGAVNSRCRRDYITLEVRGDQSDAALLDVKTSAVRFAARRCWWRSDWTLHSENAKVGWYDDPAETGNDPWSGERNYLFADGHVVYLRPANPCGGQPVGEPARLLPDINLTTRRRRGKRRGLTCARSTPPR